MLTQIIERFPQKRIVVIGDVILDHYIWGDVNRISPEAPVVEVRDENLRLVFTITFGMGVKTRQKF